MLNLDTPLRTKKAEKLKTVVKTKISKHHNVVDTLERKREGTFKILHKIRHLKIEVVNQTKIKGKIKN